MRDGLWSTVVVKDDERAFLTKNGQFVQLLGPGRHSTFDPSRRLAAEVVKVQRAEVPVDRALLLERSQPQLAEEHIVIVQPGPSEVAIVSLDGEPKLVVLPNTTRAFWKTLTRVDVETIDTATHLRLEKRHMDTVGNWTGNIATTAVVDAHEAILATRLRPCYRVRPLGSFP